MDKYIYMLVADNFYDDTQYIDEVVYKLSTDFASIINDVKAEASYLGYYIYVSINGKKLTDHHGYERIHLLSNVDQIKENKIIGTDEEELNYVKKIILDWQEKHNKYMKEEKSKIEEKRNAREREEYERLKKKFEVM